MVLSQMGRDTVDPSLIFQSDVNIWLLWSFDLFMKPVKTEIRPKKSCVGQWVRVYIRRYSERVSCCRCIPLSTRVGTEGYLG